MSDRKDIEDLRVALIETRASVMGLNARVNVLNARVDQIVVELKKLISANDIPNKQT